MAEPAIALDSDWLRAHPLPQPDNGADKNARGRVLAIGGCRSVPGGISLTAEAAFRAGAGKVQIATIASAALPLGIAAPETAVFALVETPEGEIARGCAPIIAPLLERCDAVIAGPGMSDGAAGQAVVEAILDAGAGVTVIVDAAALMRLGANAEALGRRALPPIITPHIGEMAALLDCEADAIEADRAGAVRRAASRYGAVCVLKGPTSLIAEPEGRLFAYAGGGVGLATGGSGDVLAGLAAGLAARGADPLRATLWAVWLHGEAGRRCSEQIGPLGYLARELLAHVPGLMRAI